MKFFSTLVILSTSFVLVFFTTSCKKEKVLTQGGSVTFSADTLMFDTVFTQQGSATRSIIIYNNEKQKINISSIRLKRGDESPFRLNINGIPSKEIKDIDLAAEDSMYVFAAVTIDPNAENQPFLVEDSLIVSLNGSEFVIPVVAFGQNVHYVVDSILQTQTWANDKPYVIINSATVDENQTLTIQQGTRVYMHANSTLFIAGTLKINGTKQDSVIFQGDRIDRNVLVGDYQDVPGEWGGIYFTSFSHDNVINYAVLKNGGLPTAVQGGATQGAMIQLSPDSVNNGSPQLTLTNTIIKNSQQYGILSFNSSLLMDNCLVAECQYENLMLIQGGNYTINNSTVSYMSRPGEYFSKAMNHNTVSVANYFYISQTEYLAADLSCKFNNCIIYANNGEEQEFYTDKVDGYNASVLLNHCLLKAKVAQPSFVVDQSSIFNQDPLFAGVDSFNYHVTTGSPAIGSGVQVGLTNDLDGVSRATQPTIGCYEFVP